MTLTSSAKPDMVSLLEQISSSPGSWYATIALESAFSTSLIMKTTRRSLLSAGKTRNTLSLSYLGGISTLQPCVIIQFAEILIAPPITLVHHINDIMLNGGNASLIAQLVKNLPAMQEIRVRSLGQ